MSHAVDWEWYRFDELSVHALYALLQLRSSVFVVEQQCPYLDADGWDPYCEHLVAWQGETPLACLRLVPPEVHPSGLPSIGRVCTAPSMRRYGLGRDLMARGIEQVTARYPGMACQIGAQAYLRAFYESFGFVVNGDEYDEDGILHFPMRRPAA